MNPDNTGVLQEKNSSREVEPNANVTPKKEELNGTKSNGNESATDSDSIFVASSVTPPDTASSSPNNGNASPSKNVNGIVKKTTLKAALSLDPSTLCRKPCDKIGFGSGKPVLSNPGSTDLGKVNLDTGRCDW